VRITTTLDPDVVSAIKKLMTTENLSFKDAVNQMLVLGLRAIEEAELPSGTAK
jgi:hypothetical protein